MAVAAGGMAFNLSAGQSIRRLRLEGPGDRDVRLATPICFEVTVAEVCRRMVYAADGKATDLLVNISNDGWFGGSVAGRQRHLQIARFRCIENRVPMIRAVNTGLSASVDSCGRLLDIAPARETGWVLAEPQLDTRSTVYGRLGDVLAWLCLGAAGALVVGTMIGLADEK